MKREVAAKWLAPMIAVGLALAASFWAYQTYGTWKRFHVVEEGVLYRSGLLRPDQLAQAIDRYAIKTVVSLTYSSYDDYERVCEKKGVRRYFAYLPGDGVGPDDPYLRFLEIASRRENQPVLVHCSAGVQRTGGAVALYRSVIEGWDFDRAVAEMVSLGNEGKQAQIDQLRRIQNRLTTSGECPVDIPKMASSRR